MKLPLNYKLEQKRGGLNFLILIKEQTVIHQEDPESAPLSGLAFPLFYFHVEDFH
jgi:hypothetical protein